MTASTRDLLRRALCEPEHLPDLSLANWDVLLRQARQAKVLARIAVLLEERGLTERLPEQVRAHLRAARVVADKHERVARWEANRLQHALAGLGVPIVLLKGGAYMLAGLPAARGRLCSDLDILVPKAKLPAVEQAMLRHGWTHIDLNQYDQLYYRTWMHELPPLRHCQRGTVVDVHHNILPETSRLCPDPQRLLDAAVTLAGPQREEDSPQRTQRTQSRTDPSESGFLSVPSVSSVVNSPLPVLQVLSPPDMILHTAVHLFQSGDLEGGLRDLTDLDDLLRHFGGQPGFWEALVPRAVELGVQRPLFYALRYSVRILGTPVPPDVQAAAQVGRPLAPVRWLMDALVWRALLPHPDDRWAPLVTLARFLLYVRSHWLRMPPLLLARHLARKAWRRWFTRDEEPSPPVRRAGKPPAA